ncbi:MAG: carboxypeptidase-like regulatory domain-containing protein, partial [Bacteroidetes bacterium]|nr:carboxypeptidase-like regulatory domain-containing protein [Bacteroidota bacterium]
MKTFLIRNPVFIFCFCYGIIISSTCYGQVNFSIQGNIKSQNTESFISDAAVTLYRISESGTRIPIAFTFTDIVGNFLLMVEIPKANLLLTISHIGYISIEKKITIDENIRSKNFNLLMQKNAVALDSIQIKDLPIKIKKDTIEYLASSFSNENTRKIGDLLKNIDGFVVQK